MGFPKQRVLQGILGFLTTVFTGPKADMFTGSKIGNCSPENEFRGQVTTFFSTFFGSLFCIEQFQLKVFIQLNSLICCFPSNTTYQAKPSKD